MTSANSMKLKWSVIDTKFLSDIIFFPAMLLRVAIAGKARIAYHWVTEKKRNITLNNQRRSCHFDKLRKEESSLSYWVVASENEGSRPSCEWKWGAQGDWEQQPFSPNHNPHGKAIENPNGLPKPSPRLWLRARSLQPKFRPGKVVHLKRWTIFFETFPVGPKRSIEFWTEISGNFGRMDRALKYQQVNLQAHLEATHTLTSDTAEQGTTPVLQHQHECYQSL